MSAAVAAIGLALVAQQIILRGGEQAPYGWGLCVVAAALIALGTRGETRAAVAAATPFTGGTTRGRGLWGMLAVGAIALTTAVTVWDQWPLLALAFWLTAFALATVATRDWYIAPPERSPCVWSTRESWALAAVVLLAAVARMLWIDQLPRYYFGDEARVGVFLMNKYRDGIPNLFNMGWNTWPVIGLTVQGLFAPVLGITTTALRLSSALMGTLAVVATYFLARELFSARIALLAAVLLAVNRTAIDFSRLGICHAQVMFLEPLAFFLWWRAVNTGQALYYLWAGIGMGLCLYTYNAGQSVPLLWVGWVLLCVVSAPRLVRTHRRAALLTFAACALTFFPYFFYATDSFTFGRNWGEFTIMARNRQTLSQAIDAWNSSGAMAVGEILQRQVWLTWLGFGVIPAGAYGLGYRGGGMLDNVTAPLFVLGLAMSLPRLRRGRDAFVPFWWLFTSVVGGVMTNDPPAVVRLVGILPALTILAALPLDWLMRQMRGRLAAPLAAALAGLLLVAAGWDNWRTYFVAMPAARADDSSELIRFIQQQPPNSAVRVVGSEYHLRVNNEELFMLDFPGRDFRDVADPAEVLPIREVVQTPLAVVLAPAQSTLSGPLKTLYPEAVVTDVRYPDGRLIFRALLLTPESIAARAGLAMHVYDAQGAVLVTRVADPFAPLHAPPTGASAARVEWRGSIFWPTDQPAALVAHSRTPLTLRLGNFPPLTLGADETATLPVELPRGWQPLMIDETAVVGRELSLSIVEPAGTTGLTRWQLRPESTSEGLRAEYVRDGAPLLRAVEPLPDAFAVEDMYRPPNDLPVRAPFSVSWRGTLEIGSPGRYQFEALSSGPYTVRLDGTPLFAAPAVNAEQPELERAARDLQPGAHPLSIDWDSTKRPSHTRRVFQLFWIPPGQERELIPPAHLSPSNPDPGQAS